MCDCPFYRGPFIELPDHPKQCLIQIKSFTSEEWPEQSAVLRQLWALQRLDDGFPKPIAPVDCELVIFAETAQWMGAPEFKVRRAKK